MANRILKWFVYTLLLALLPILITSLFSLLFNLKELDHTSELLFFIIMICATSLNDIQEAKKYIEKDIVFNFFFSVSILMIITVSVIYGGLILLNMVNYFGVDSFKNLKIFTVILSFVSAIMGLLIQIILYKTERIEVPL